MAYYISRTVSRPFDAVVTDLTAGLKEQGFGVLTDIDVQATLKSKIGADMMKYRILGACARASRMKRCRSRINWACSSPAT